MKILHVNTSDTVGGAAIAALRLVQAERALGHDAQLLCRDHTLPDDTEGVLPLRTTLWQRSLKAVERILIIVQNGLSMHNLWRIDTAQLGIDITRLKAFKEADIIHLHWVNQGMLSLRDIERILRSGKRVVWTLHDMWPFTGVCHHAAQCERWKNGEGCGKCPLLKRPKAVDMSARTYRRKLKAYRAGHFTAVGCSRWLAGLAAESPLFEGQRVVSIANVIDTDFYQPTFAEGQPSQANVRQALGISAEERVLLFIARDVADPNKGINFLIEALQAIATQQPELAEHITLLLVGLNSERYATTLPSPVKGRAINYCSDEGQLRQLYQAADLLVMPTLMDNLPNTIAEASACGLPTIAFGVGGVPQMVETGVNGYLAQPEQAADFAQGIIRCLCSDSLQAMARNARTIAIKNYSPRSVAEAYLNL